MAAGANGGPPSADAGSRDGAARADGGPGGGRADAGPLTSSCVGGAAWPTADPAVAGPFAVVADKNVGPLAGVVPDPVYGNTQQHFNVYRPKDLAQGNYCHPILVWANGHTDNPEPNPPDCQSSKYCGSYLMLMNQLASHGFVVIASLSTITSQGNPLPTIVGLDWLIQQADDPTSPDHHRLDTAHIGALGHSEGGLSTSKASSDPRISAVATVSGSGGERWHSRPVALVLRGERYRRFLRQREEDLRFDHHPARHVRRQPSRGSRRLALPKRNQRSRHFRPYRLVPGAVDGRHGESQDVLWGRLHALQR